MPQLASMPHDYVVVLSPSPEGCFVLQQACYGPSSISGNRDVSDMV